MYALVGLISGVVAAGGALRLHPCDEEITVFIVAMGAAVAGSLPGGSTRISTLDGTAGAGVCAMLRAGAVSIARVKKMRFT
jgi:hypothetical protein